jgi:hypothetical protein
VLGGDNYGLGARGGEAGTSIYFNAATESGINQVDNVFTPGDPYTITVTARGGAYSAYIDGAANPVTTLVDDTFPIGQVGLYDDQPNTITGAGFGTPTTFSNFTLTGIAAPPGISLFSPGDGQAGTEVKITGGNLQLATAVTFQRHCREIRATVSKYGYHCDSSGPCDNWSHRSHYADRYGYHRKKFYRGALAVFDARLYIPVRPIDEPA